MSTYLSIILIGFGRAGLKGAIGRALKSISWPEGQSAECTWRLEVTWEGDTVWTIQSTPTMTDSGHEMGSLRIEESLEPSLPQDFVRAILRFNGFTLASYRIASASESDVVSDCAIALIDSDGRELAISTAPAPGAVSLRCLGKPWPRTEFDPSVFVWRPEIAR